MNLPTLPRASRTSPVSRYPQRVPARVKLTRAYEGFGWRLSRESMKYEVTNTLMQSTTPERLSTTDILFSLVVVRTGTYPTTSTLFSQGG